MSSQIRQWRARLRGCWISLQHFNVVIFTTRAKSPAGRFAVRGWLRLHGVHVKDEDVTAEKPPALIYLDDRAYRFEGPGTFPTKEQIHAARPWNKEKSHA